MLELASGSIIRLKRLFDGRYRRGILQGSDTAADGTVTVRVFLFDSSGTLPLLAGLPKAEAFLLKDLVLEISPTGTRLNHDFFPRCSRCDGLGLADRGGFCPVCKGRGCRSTPLRVHPELL